MKLVFALCFFTLSLSATISVDLFLNLNQCNTCNMGLNGLNRLAPSVLKTIHLPQSLEDAASELLEPLGPVKNLKLKFYESGNTPFPDPLTRSYCFLYDNGQRIDSFVLNDLLSKTAEINKMANAFVPVKTIALPETLKLSARTSLSCHKNYVSLFDYTLNKNVLLTLDAKRTKVLKNFTVRSADFPPDPFLRSGSVDTAMYRAYYKYLVYMGKTRPDISGSYLTDSSLYLTLAFPCAIRPPGADTGIGGKMFLYRKNLFTQKSELFSVEKMELNLLGADYYVDNTAGFYTKGNTVYFSVYPDKPSKTANHLMAKFHLRGNKADYLSFTDFSVPDSVFSNHGEKEWFNSASNAEFYFGVDRPVFVNIKTNKGLNLEKELGSIYHQQSCLDAVQDGERFKLLLLKNNKVACVLYDPVARKVISELNVKLPPTCNKECVKFIDPATLVAMDVTNKKLVLLQTR